MTSTESTESQEPIAEDEAAEAFRDLARAVYEERARQQPGDREPFRDQGMAFRVGADWARIMLTKQAAVYEAEIRRLREALGEVE